MEKNKINNLCINKQFENIVLQKQPILKGELTGYPSIDKPWLKKAKYSIDDMPSSKMTLYNFLHECNKDHMDDIALIYDPVLDGISTSITYKELFKKIDECAKAYVALGVKKGDIVTVCLPSFVENIINLYALNKIGAIANQIHPLVSQDELEFYLDEAKSKVFVSYGDIYKKIDNINHNLNKVILVSPSDSMNLKSKFALVKKQISNEGILFIKKMMPDKEYKDSKKSEMYISWDKFLKLGKNVENSSIITNTNCYDIAVITHTSGTTGKSKGVMTNSLALNSSVNSVLQETSLFQRHDKELMILPPFPLYILNNVVHLSMCRGIELVVIPKVDYSKLSEYFKKHKPNHMKGIPSTIDSILRDKGFDDVDLSNFKFLISGGGKLTKEKEINEFLTSHNCKYKIANGYGMSEVGGCLTCMFDNTYEEGTVGRPLIGSNAKAVDLETKQEIKYTEEKEGEIWLSGPFMMDGYYENQQETNCVLVEDSNGNRWIKTGDLGKITEEGNIKIIGRIKRMTFIFDADNNTASKVSHDYVETTLCENKNVDDCIVVSVEDSKSQNALKAYILLNDSPYDTIIGNLDEMCKKRFRKYVSPIEYIVVDSIPKTKAGKNDYMTMEAYENGKLEEEKVKVKVLYRKQIGQR